MEMEMELEESRNGGTVSMTVQMGTLIGRVVVQP